MEIQPLVLVGPDVAVEDEGVRPIHRPREWKERERRLEKEAKVTN